MAFGSRRAGGSWLSRHPVVLGQEPVKSILLPTGVIPPGPKNGSLIKLSVVPAGTPCEAHDGAGSPVTGSLVPQTTGRVVAGSKTAPKGKVLPSTSVFTQSAFWMQSGLVCTVTSSAKLVNPLDLSRSVGTEFVPKTWPCRRRKAS